MRIASAMETMEPSILGYDIMLRRLTTICDKYPLFLLLFPPTPAEHLVHHGLSNSSSTAVFFINNTMSHSSDPFSGTLPASAPPEFIEKIEEDSIELDTDQSSDHSPQIKEKGQAFVTVNAEGEEELIADDDPRVKGLPSYVRKVVSLTDNPTLPMITFRYFLLSFLFVAPGAFLEQMNSFRTTFAPYSIFFVQIASNYVGVWLAKVLPAWGIRIPFTPWSFNLNPGPFSVKEHVLVTITAASGATVSLGFAPLAISEAYLGQPVHPAKSIFFMWAIVGTGMSYAALARQFLIYDPVYPW